MLKQAVIRCVDKILSNPAMFGLQQKLCNDYRPIKDWFAPVIDKPGVKLLDVGCSVGTCAGQIIDMQRIDYTGIDISPDYIRTAAARYPYGKFHAMDASRLDFADASFDVILFICVVHHMSDALMESCLKDLRRVLKPGGQILVADPIFTPGRMLSSLLLHLDRGRYIRSEEGYRQIFKTLNLKRDGYAEVSLHRIYMTHWESPL